MALSQIYRTSGDHFAATWEQQVATRSSKKILQEERPCKSLAKAIRAFRLGQVHRALEEYLAVDDGIVRRNQKSKPGLQSPLLALLGDYDRCIEHIHNWSQEGDATPKYLKELAWEEICIHASRDQDLEPMIQAIQRKGTHYQAVYILKPIFGPWPGPKKAISSHKMTTIARNKNLQAKEFVFLKGRSLLEECNDSSIPLVIRIKALGNILKESNQFLAIDRELRFTLHRVDG